MTVSERIARVRLIELIDEYPEISLRLGLVYSPELKTETSERRQAEHEGTGVQKQGNCSG